MAKTQRHFAVLIWQNIVTLPNRKRNATGNAKYAYLKGPYYVYSTKALLFRICAWSYQLLRQQTNLYLYQRNI